MNYNAISVASQGLSALLFMGVLIFLWFKFAQPAVAAAQEAQNREIEENERHRDESRAAIARLRQEMMDARDDAQAIAERVAIQAERERVQALAEARESGERALNNARGELDLARANAAVQLRDEMLERALVLARSDAAARVTQALHAGLVDAFIGTLGTSRN